MDLIKRYKDKVLSGNELSWDNVKQLGATPEHEALWAAAEEITCTMCPRKFDTCSIANAKSGKCSENCKWCAQSAHYHTGCDEYDIIDHDECLRQAAYNHNQGINRFSLVASGRALKGHALDKICAMLHEVREDVGINTCASLGLLGRDELQQLWDAGVRRYHCNLETAPSYFPELCTTHTIDDKLHTIREAKAIGFEICSGGIIGMGETAEQRYELAYKLKEVAPQSIPINILCPIPGTPLADMAPLTEQEIMDTIAMFRFIHPRVQLRFAGGRARMSRAAQLQALRIGVNGGIVGDLLTTIGSKVNDDASMIREAGYEF